MNVSAATNVAPYMSHTENKEGKKHTQTQGYDFLSTCITN